MIRRGREVEEEKGGGPVAPAPRPRELEARPKPFDVLKSEATPKPPPPPEPPDLPDAATLRSVAKAHAKAKRALGGGEEGKKKLLQDIQEGLITAMYLEKEAGERPKDAGKSTEANARQSRKQFKELAELVLDVVLEIEDTA